MKVTQTLTREELYELVWKTPMIKLAKQFSLLESAVCLWSISPLSNPTYLLAVHLHHFIGNNLP